MGDFSQSRHPPGASWSPLLRSTTSDLITLALVATSAAALLREDVDMPPPLALLPLLITSALIAGRCWCNPLLPVVLSFAASMHALTMLR